MAKRSSASSIMSRSCIGRETKGRSLLSSSLWFKTTPASRSRK
ncbi:Uncharacterised protein [Vibrio cholerae]|nr:Uncharacterised protein [Vibrio cholerae]